MVRHHWSQAPAHGCAGGIDNGINTVRLAYIRAGAGHALIASRQWIPTGLPLEPTSAPRVSLPCDAWSDGVRFDGVVGDEVYGVVCWHDGWSGSFWWAR